MSPTTQPASTKAVWDALYAWLRQELGVYRLDETPVETKHRLALYTTVSAVFGAEVAKVVFRWWEQKSWVAPPSDYLVKRATRIAQQAGGHLEEIELFNLGNTRQTRWVCRIHVRRGTMQYYCASVSETTGIEAMERAIDQLSITLQR
ncbi:MAG: hypothetical protein ACYDBJ_20805 [Aggregatilineales bacterium]